MCSFHSVAQIYKWVDEKGHTYYSDCPPEDCESEEVELTDGPTDEEIETAQTKLRKMLEARQARDLAVLERREQEIIESEKEAELEEQRSQKCVKALYQIKILSQKRRIFKFQSDGSRLYLENEDRPAEISRLRLLEAEYCETDQTIKEKQIHQAEELSTALSRRCAAARTTLEKLQKSGSAPDEEKLQNQRDYVEAFCPDVEEDDLWLADWIIIRKWRFD
jgi:hypothetical protein